jgi:hypothetical protein
MDCSWDAGHVVYLESGSTAMSAASRLAGCACPMRMDAALRAKKEDVAAMDLRPASACCLIVQGFNLLKTAGAG